MLLLYVIKELQIKTVVYYYTPKIQNTETPDAGKDMEQQEISLLVKHDTATLEESLALQYLKN